MTAAQLAEVLEQRSRDFPHEPDWRIRRLTMLVETGRTRQAIEEKLHHALLGKNPGTRSRSIDRRRQFA